VSGLDGIGSSGTIFGPLGGFVALTRFVGLGPGVGLTTLVGLILLMPFVGFAVMGSFGVDSLCFEGTVAAGIGAVHIFFVVDVTSLFVGLFLLFNSGMGI
jgi:hypothetical protein